MVGADSGHLQLTRFYGYPHASGPTTSTDDGSGTDGQDLIAEAALWYGLFDLTTAFGSSPVHDGHLQLMRLYGYPHASGPTTSTDNGSGTDGQDLIADAARSVASASWQP